MKTSNKIIKIINRIIAYWLCSSKNEGLLIMATNYKKLGIRVFPKCAALRERWSLPEVFNPLTLFDKSLIVLVLPDMIRLRKEP